MKASTTKELTKIQFGVPVREAARVRRALVGMLALVGRGAGLLDENEIDDDALYTIEEVFPDSTPGSRLRGLRTREGITQQQLANAIGIQQHHVADMESGKRKISVAMARRISRAYSISHRVFL